MKYPSCFFVISLLLVGSIAQADTDNVKWPGDYQEGFTLYFSGDRTANNKQIIRIYANDAALHGFRTDGKLPFGSVLVGEIYAAKLNDEGEPKISALGRRIADKLAAVVVMERGAGFDTEYPDALKTGDWEFAVFNPSGERLKKDITECRACHHPLSNSQFTFSLEHLR